MSTITNGTPVKLHNGRTVKLSPRTYNTETGLIAWLTTDEAKTMRLPGAWLAKYEYSIDSQGNVERWINGYGGYIGKIAAPATVAAA